MSRVSRDDAVRDCRLDLVEMSAYTASADEEGWRSLNPFGCPPTCGLGAGSASSLWVSGGKVVSAHDIFGRVHLPPVGPALRRFPMGSAFGGFYANGGYDHSSS